MEALKIQEGQQTPEVEFDGNNGIFRIAGKSYPENVNVFYKPLFEYIEAYKDSPAPKTTVEFHWLYYNTATSKMIMRIIMFLKDAGTEIEIDWYYNPGFEMIKEKGEEIKDILDVPIHIKQI